MAKKQEELFNLRDTFLEFKESKNIDTGTMTSVLEDSFRSVLARIFGSDENINVTVNFQTGDCEITREREIVADGDVTDENKQITLSEATKIQSDYEIGEDVTEKIDFNTFGRRAILTLRQTLGSKILDLEHDTLYNKYKVKIGEIVSAEIYQIWKNEVLLVDDAGNELHLLKADQIPDDFYRKGDALRCVVARVDNINNNPKIYVSRTAKEFLGRLLEEEVPEIADGLITVKGIARIPGVRAKIAVESYADRIDPVGSCVGAKGSRIHGIVKELHGENLDIINYTANPSLLIQRALSPAKIVSITLNEEDEDGIKRADVYLHPDEVPKAIGYKGANIKLASMITGYTIEVFRQIDGEEAEDDIYLDEFADEIEEWIIDELKRIGLDTAKSVLKQTPEFLVEKTELEESTVEEVLNVLKAEFEENEE